MTTGRVVVKGHIRGGDSDVDDDELINVWKQTRANSPLHDFQQYLPGDAELKFAQHLHEKAIKLGVLSEVN